MAIKPRSVPSKTLVQNLASNGAVLYPNNTLDWDLTQLAAADFGSQLFACLRNPTNTQVEFIELDPATVTSSNAITILKRGLGYDGTQVAGTETAYDWNAFETIIEFGAATPQLIAQLVEEVGAETIAGLKTFSTIPRTTGGNATDDNELVRYAQALALLTGGTYSQNRVVIAGLAGETITSGQLVYLKASDGRWWLCDADTAATVENVILGIAQGAGTVGNTIASGVMVFGLDTVNTLTANTKYFASNTAGGFATSAGTKEVSLGVTDNSGKLFLFPRYDQTLTEDLQDALAGGGSYGTPSASNPFRTLDYGEAAVVRTYNADDTWTKPSRLKYIDVEAWGAGGGGGGNNSGGGGGGAYNKLRILAADLAATEAVTVGAGGSAGNNSAGGAGGNSSFGAHLTAYGGGGGGSGNNGAGGGGGGLTSAGGTAVTTTAGAGGGVPAGSTGAGVSGGDSTYGGGGGGAGAGTGTYNGGKSVFGGGGGAGGGNGAGGGLSVYGGGGGGTAANGGTSVYGGAGGNAAAGTAPGGGGGGSGTVGYAGAAGRVKVTEYYY